jgi:alkanesulfonate monooxygenase SsuD/methylene tetrahydromethanopterin reductase-like flavin-dependent oxidoreductase (luciferase family)
MFIGHFTERPYQDASSGLMGGTERVQDLSISNGEYDPLLGSQLYNRYFDERVYAEEMGFDGIMLNEHHSTPFCMGGVMNVEAAVLARITKTAKIVLMGNVLPIHDDPLWLAEELAMIDMISKGRLVTGWVRGTGRESIAHNAQPPFNWERYQEAHDFIVKAWTTPGPFRWEGEHYDFRYVNPWARPYQQPHPQMWIPGGISKNTVQWAAKHRYPYVMLATRLEPTKQSFEYYDEVADEMGYERGTQHIGYLWKVHVDETEELALETGRKYLEGPGNIFLEGSRAVVAPHLQNLPGLSDRTNVLPTSQVRAAQFARGQAPRGSIAANQAGYEEQLENYTISVGTPKTILPKIRHVLEYLRPGSVFFWDGDGAMTHEDQMRSLRLMGEEVLPAVREMADELGLKGPFEIDTQTNEPFDEVAAAPPQLAAAVAGDE